MPPSARDVLPPETWSPVLVLVVLAVVVAIVLFVTH